MPFLIISSVTTRKISVTTKKNLVTTKNAKVTTKKMFLLRGIFKGEETSGGSRLKIA